MGQPSPSSAGSGPDPADHRRQNSRCRPCCLSPRRDNKARQGLPRGRHAARDDNIKFRPSVRQALTRGPQAGNCRKRKHRSVATHIALAGRRVPQSPNEEG
eukprot:11498989-Alexandrium_andersonii.AAC.1